MLAHLDSYQRRRINTLRAFMVYIRDAGNRSAAYRAAAAKTGMSWKRVETLFGQWQRDGDEALIDKRRLPKAKASASDRLNLTAEERAALRNIVLRCDSKQLALEVFADHPSTRTELRDYIKRYSLTRNYPKALLSAARVTPEERALSRGHRTFEMRSHTQLRDMTYIDEAGIEHPLEGGDLVECDDMSLNQPFWYEWPYGGDPLSDMFRVRIGRQMLAAVDVATGKWLGFDLIGRIRDAYRAEDVLRFLGRICETHGRPRLGFRLERGVWMSNSVRGVKGTTDDDERATIGSVRDLVDIQFVWKPKAKPFVEGGFNFLQTVQALTGVTIGRRRGEYEETTRLMLQCVNARKHPKDIGLRYITDAAATVAQSMQKSDDRPKLGRLLRGIPQEKFTAAVTARPLLQVPEESLHLFLPVKQIRPIDSGHVRCRVPHYNQLFSFRVPASCAHLGNKYKLLVCFDPANLAAGARVLDAESERLRSYDSVEGQYYGIFPYAPNAPQLDRRTVKTGDAFAAKKEYQAAARTHFRATRMAVGTGASIDHINDGNGNAVSRSEGITPRPDQVTPQHDLAERFVKAGKAHASRGIAQAEDVARARRLLLTPTAPTSCTTD